MKRLGSSDSLNPVLISICTSTEEQTHVYGRGFDFMVEEEESAGGGQKKRRLSLEQVKGLEKNFEVENKLEPDRKVKLAQELNLQPRQVAVWFQNRRARWKTKQLEIDYGILKSNYDSLELTFESLKQENQALLNKIKELKSKMNEESNVSIKQEESNNNNNNREMVVTEVKDGNSDSDSSAILNEYVKMEEHELFSEEGCNFYSEDQAPSLHWYTQTDQWA